MSENDTCGVCGGQENLDMVACDHCDRWFDFECVNLTREETDRIKFFYCDSCESLEELNLITVWKGRKPTAAERVDKRKNYHEVEKILANKSKRVGRVLSRLFKVKWKGFSESESTWEPEHHLDGCIDTLQHYLREQGLPLSHQEALLGGSFSSKFNIQNWCKIEDVYSIFLTYKNEYFPRVNLSSKIFDQLSNQDAIYFMEHDGHCFVLLYLADRRVGYIADGGNFFLNSFEKAKEIRELLGIRLRTCKFDQQVRVDYCASSAILIALELVRAYNDGNIPKLLISPASWRDRIIKRMHKYKSTPAVLTPLHLRRRLYKCHYCNRSFRSNRNRLEKHMRACNMKN